MLALHNEVPSFFELEVVEHWDLEENALVDLLPRDNKTTNKNTNIFLCLVNYDSVIEKKILGIIGKKENG